MAFYFDDLQAVSNDSHGDAEATVSRIAARYIQKNPRYEYTARPYITDGILRGKDYRYVADFSKFFPEAADGMYTYARGIYRSSSSAELQFTLIPFGPVKLWMNGKQIYGTDIVAERYSGKAVALTIPVKKGINRLLLRFTKTKAGFGGEFGTWLGKLDYFFTRGLSGYTEIEGFDYTLPFTEVQKELQEYPEKWDNLFIRPHTWTEAEKAKGCFGRLYGTGIRMKGLTAVAVCSVSGNKGACTVTCDHTGDSTLYMGRKEVCHFSGTGKDSAVIHLSGRKETLVLYSVCPGTGCWNAALSFSGESGPVTLQSVFFDKRTPESAAAYVWSYTGPFRYPGNFRFDRDRPAGTFPDVHWYHLDMPDCWVRLYNENPLFGHWNYPLGVTLYGLTELSRYFLSKDPASAFGKKISSYVCSHVSKAVRTFDYARFDHDMFGGATAVHHLLTSLDSLDDCGSFGSLMLEVAKDHSIADDYKRIAEYAGNYILHKQSRLEDGTFFRKEMMHHFHDGTMWADDLYMSIPFLCRYAALTGNDAIFDDAAGQFAGFKERLFMPESSLMAHVYDFKRGMNTGVPWGRGNGWVIFSLTELLRVLPEDHCRRAALLDFFRTLAAAYLRCQDESGMWHQVLTMPSSYPETSCTAMFICAFSRGIRYGWFAGDTEPYRKSCIKAWNALEHTSIDRNGNIYGVCRGSEFSFNPKYYAEHLLPRLNDTHGIGIVILAGVEILSLK